MRPLSANDFIRARELGETHDAVDRAVAILAFAFPDESDDVLRRLPLGRRNERLLALRERLFGDLLNAFAECPACGTALEFTMRSAGLRVQPREQELLLEAEGYTVRFRLLDSRDLKAAARSASVAEARARLLQSCVVEAYRGEDRAAVDELPTEVVDALSARLEECDPQAETLIALVCPQCAHEWQLSFDVASFLHAEISAHGRRLLHEVHMLARTYGWSERDILAMSAHRRRDYLAMVLND